MPVNKGQEFKGVCLKRNLSAGRSSIRFLPFVAITCGAATCASDPCGRYPLLRVVAVRSALASAASHEGITRDWDRFRHPVCHRVCVSGGEPWRGRWVLYLSDCSYRIFSNKSAGLLCLARSPIVAQVQEATKK